ncbi:MAG TPA: hypothetical protein VKM35_07840 [Arenimonas sp.]|uniref:hypothetical protein n=1 Tax=Arenimonas sp. TaxID=1872635 RepID=UPI002BD78824|nr:hypothetical protein [Arenimonas sp.]HMB57107.1 hypothetical protein [Arenimonas sp.]
MHTRLCLLSQRQAWPWRWEMALLEVGCQQGWRLPGADVLAQRARQLGRQLQESDATIALAFEGYSVVGACWMFIASTAADAGQLSTRIGPYVLPNQLGRGLADQLQKRIAEAGASLSSNPTLVPALSMAANG